MSYYPYFRGKSFELITIRENAERMQRACIRLRLPRLLILSIAPCVEIPFIISKSLTSFLR